MTRHNANPSHDEGFRRVLGLKDATCVVVGAIIGVGIFFTPSRVVQQTGSAGLALLAWAIGGGIALLGALAFAELGGLYPRSGGQYQALRDAYGPLPAFLFVFCNATAIQAGAIAIIAVICSRHVSVALRGDVCGPLPTLVVASALIVGLAAANVAGVKWGSKIQNVTVYAKVATLLLVALLAAATATAPPSGPTLETAREVGGGLARLSGLLAALVPALFSFGGWQHALWIAGEVRQPHRNVPAAIIAGVLIVVTVYLLANWAYLDLLGCRGVAESHALAADAVGAIWPRGGQRVAAAAVGLSAFGVLNAQLLSGPRLVYGLASDGRLFAPFARVSARFGTPVPAVLLLSGLGLVLLWGAGEDGVDKLLTGVVFIDGVFFAMTGLAVIVLRRTRAETARPVRVPGYPVVPALFVLGEIGVVVGAYCDPTVRQASFIGLTWIAAASVCYFLFFRRGQHP